MEYLFKRIKQICSSKKEFRESVKAIATDAGLGLNEKAMAFNVVPERLASPQMVENVTPETFVIIIVVIMTRYYYDEHDLMYARTIQRCHNKLVAEDKLTLTEMGFYCALMSRLGVPFEFMPES